MDGSTSKPAVKPRFPQAGDFWTVEGVTYYCVGMCPYGFPVWMEGRHGEERFGRFEIERFSNRVLLNSNPLAEGV